MASVYEELSAKAGGNGSRGSRDGARRDLGLMLYAEREAIRELWLAADRAAAPGSDEGAALRGAVERLRPFFGERA